MFWFRDLASPGKSRQVLASSGRESIIPCCTDFSYIQQTRLPNPETVSGHSQFRPGRGPDPQRAGRRMVAVARRGNGLILSSGKLSTSEKTQAIFSRCTSSRQVGTAADLCGECILWLNLTTGSRVRQGGGQPPNARFVTEENLALSEYPYIRQWLWWLRRRGGGKGQAWLGGCGNERWGAKGS